MKKISFLIFIIQLIIAQVVLGQVSTDPAIFTATQAVTLTYDASQSQGQQLANLPANITTITAHIGAIIDGASSSNWTNVPGTWGDPNAQPKFTREGNTNIYKLTLANGVRSMFPNLPANATLYRVGMVFRENGACGGFGGVSTNCKEGKTSAGQDIFLNVNQGGLEVAFTSPASNISFVNVGDNISITANTNQVADLKLYVNNNEVASQTSATSISFSQAIVANPAKYNVKVTATVGNTTVEKSLYFLVKQTTPTANLPSGTKLGINYLSTTSARLALLAPQKSKVYVIGDFNNWELDPAYLMNYHTAAETYWLNINGLVSGQEYGFQYAVFDANENRINVGDPFADKLLFSSDTDAEVVNNYPNVKAYPTGKTTGAVTVLQTNQTPYNWQVSNFQKPAKEKLIVYELLIRDFDNGGSIQNVINRLDYLRTLGINAIELMPVMEFSGNDSWGYNPIYYFAVDKSYGTKDKLKELIDLAHQKGIAVILDMVLNQADDDFTYARLYAKNANPWFNETAKHPYNVFNDFNHDSPYTQRFVDSVSVYWLNEYKFDGLRFDLAKGFTQNAQCGGSTSNESCISQKHDDRIATFKRIADKMWAADANAYVILELFANNDEETIYANYRANEGKGMMPWGNLHFAYKQNSIGSSNNSDITWIYDGTLAGNTGGRGWDKHRLIGYMESHDEERIMVDNINFGGSSGNYNIKQIATGLDRVKAAAAFLFLIPGPKMVWQFGELGYDISINQNGRTGKKPIKWEYFDDANRKKVYKVFAELFKLKTSYDVFNSTDVSILGGTSLLKQITITSQPYTNTPANANQMNVHIIGNFGLTAQNITTNFQHTGTWYHYFEGGTAYNATNKNMSINLQPGEFRIYTDYQLPAPDASLIPSGSATAPTAISAIPNNPTANEVVITWQDNATNETGFSIKRSTTSGSGYTEIGTTGANTGTFSDTDVSIGTTYYYIVCAKRSGQADACSAEINSGLVAVENNALSRAIRVFPNPSQGNVRLTFDNLNFQSVQLQIIDTFGKQIDNQDISQKINANGIELDIQHLPKGLYLLQFLTDKGIALKRIMKN